MFFEGDMLVFGGSTCACTIFPHVMFNVLFLRSFRENLPILFGTGMWGTQRLTKVTWIRVWVIITRPVIPAINRSGGKPIWLVEGFSKQFMPLGWLLTLTSGLLIRNISGLYHVYIPTIQRYLYLKNPYHEAGFYRPGPTDHPCNTQLAPAATSTEPHCCTACHPSPRVTNASVHVGLQRATWRRAFIGSVGYVTQLYQFLFSHLICTTPRISLKNKMKREVPTASLKGEKKLLLCFFRILLNEF